MIDLHCHILPAVDDGAQRLEDSVGMATLAARDGVQTVVATPHGSSWAYTGNLLETLERVRTLRTELESQKVDLEVLAGLEVYLTPETPDSWSQGRLFTLNGSRYILVEFPPNSVPVYAEQTLFQLQLRGLVPVIAHPERNFEIASNPALLKDMVDRGMLAQLTAGSLLGSFGMRTKELAESYVTCRLVHIIASDGHDASGRSPCLSAAVHRASQLIGREGAESMVNSLPSAILQDREVAIPEAEIPHKRSWLAFGGR